MANKRKPPTTKRPSAQAEAMAETPGNGLDNLIAELKNNRDLYFRLSTDPQSVVGELKGLDDNERALVSVVNPKDLISIDFHRASDGDGCGTSCGASCGGSCGASCGASCGGSCGGSCGASCGGSCVASCAASCIASCVASGVLAAVDDWYTTPLQEMEIDDAQKLIPLIRNEIKEFSAFMR